MIRIECAVSGDAVLVSPSWPESMLITQHLLGVIDPKYIQVDGDELTFTLVNAHAKYHILGKAGGYPVDVLTCQLISGERCS